MTGRARLAVLTLAALAALAAAACGATGAGPAPSVTPSRSAANTHTQGSGTAVASGRAQPRSTTAAAPGVSSSTASRPTPTATAAPAETPVGTPRSTAATVAPSSPSPAPAAASTPRPTATAAAASANDWTDAVDPTRIPVGDGRVSSTPRVGYVDSCTTTFRGGGAEHAGAWLDAAAGTWNLETKISVAGERYWSNATFNAHVQGATRVITSVDLPVGVPTGTFPIARSDPAFQFDRNPNAIATQSVTYQLPANPVAAASPSCTGLGPIGITTDGVFLYNALDDGGRDAGAHEVQDSCQGHPDGRERYHYHSISGCLESPQPGTSMLVGYALDGYGIYAEWNAAGHLPTNADLDACHGRTSTITWDGAPRSIYHYDVTLEYPYTVGCYHGAPIPANGPR